MLDQADPKFSEHLFRLFNPSEVRYEISELKQRDTTRTAKNVIKLNFLMRNSHECNLQSFTVERGKVDFMSFRFLIFETVY